MPAMRAVPSTSPFGASPRATAAAVSGAMRTIARATARRSVTGLAPTSTIRALPCSSRWVRSATREGYVLGHERTRLHAVHDRRRDRACVLPRPCVHGLGRLVRAADRPAVRHRLPPLRPHPQGAGGRALRREGPGG